MLLTDPRWPKWQVYSGLFCLMKYYSNGEQVIDVKISMLKLEVILVKEHYMVE